MPASLLHKSELESLLTGPTPIISAFGTAPVNYTLKEASVDLSIGDIFVPGTSKDEPGGLANARDEIPLGQGQTVVIRTAEQLALPKGISAIGFPPSTEISLPGLLTTNPGLVDPGFTGPLHLTVINMGKEPFTLRRGDRIMRLLIFRNPNVSGGPDAGQVSPLTEKVMSKLSHEFLDVSDRAKTAATEAISTSDRRTRLFAIWLPILTIVAAAVGAYIASYQALKSDFVSRDENLTAQIAATNERVAKLETREATATEMRDLRDAVTRLQDQVSTSRKKANE
ncbi:MAG TPA: hypothetical protein VGM17_17465 [Rhizomicrobium sp.]|jgi:dUTP pyrophosphatase